MIRHLVLQTQAAEPAVGQVQMHFLTQAPLRADAETVAHDQHANHQLRVDRRAARVAVERGEVFAQVAEIQKSIDPAQQMIARNMIVEIEGVEQSLLTC